MGAKREYNKRTAWAKMSEAMRELGSSRAVDTAGTSFGYFATESGTLFAWLGIASKVGKDSGIPDAGKVVAKSLKPMDTDPPEGP